MMLDMIGVLIGFALVMLILSLVVTGLVEVTVHGIRLRALNLRNGLVRYLNNLKAGDDEYDAETVMREALKFANPLDSGQCRKGSKAADWTLGTPHSWVTLEQLTEALPADGSARPFDLRKKVERSFDAFEKQLSRRYTVVVRYITVVYAVLVAGYFQVSSLDLLDRLYDDAVWRESLVAAATDYVEQDAPRAVAELADVSGSALAELERSHPELKEELEEVSGVGDDRDVLVAEVELVLADVPDLDHAAITQEYALILERLEADAVRKGLDSLREERSRLAALGIAPWPQGGDFFASARNVLGTLITALLITFGAPTWFRILSELINLRDVIAPRKRKEDTTG